MATLKPKHRQFVENFLLHFNATQAAIDAKYSVNGARQIAFKLLTRADIQEAIAERQQELAAGLEVTPESIAAELSLLGFADMRTYVEWGPGGVTLKESVNLPQGASRAVLEVSETITKDGHTIRFKLADKKGALDSLAKHLGMFVERKQIDLNVQWEFVIGEGYVDETPEKNVIEGEVIDEM